MAPTPGQVRTDVATLSANRMQLKHATLLTEEDAPAAPDAASRGEQRF
jgi:hypothetical protein